MSDISVRLGTDFKDEGIREMIADVRAARAELNELSVRFKDLGASESEAAAVMKSLKVDSGEARSALREVYGSTEQAATGFSNANQSARVLRVGLVALTAEMALMSIASGEQLPEGLRETARGMETVLQMALAGGAAFGPWGAAVGAGAGALMALATAAGQANPDVQDLNRELENLANKGKTAETLATIMGWTQGQAEAALTGAKNNRELAEALDLVAKDRQAPTWMDWLGKVWQDPNKAINDALKGLTPWGARENLQERQDNAAQLDEALANEARIKAFEEAGEKSNKFYEDVTRASQAYSDELARERQQISQFADRAGDAYVQAAQSRLTAERNNALAIERINRDLANTLERIEQDRADRIDKILRESADRSSDIDYNERKQREEWARDDQRKREEWARDDQRKKEEYAQEDARRARQLAERLLSIRLDEARSLTALDFNTHDDLQHAKTNREREEILRRYQFQRGQIISQANEQRTAAERQFDEERRLAEERRAMERRLTAERREEERKLSAERRAQALQDFQHQRELNERETAERIADAELVAQRQIEAARERNAQQTADLEQNLRIQMTDIEARYTFELAQIERAKTAFLAAERAKLDALLNTLRGVGQNGMGPGFDPSKIPGFDTGGMVPGPRGAPAVVLAHGGEEIVRPGKQSRSMKEASPQYVNVTVPDVLRPAFAAMLEQFVNGHVFKDGVKLIMSDESWR